jgi:hypothetical protein
MMGKYKILSTSDVIVQDSTGSWVNGKRVYFELTDYEETHFADVSSLKESVVKAALDKVVQQRDAVAQLTGEPVKK